MYLSCNEICSNGALMRGTGAERVRKEMIEWMYGSDEGEAKGSPGALIGNLRESVAKRDRKNTGIMTGYDLMNIIINRYIRMIHTSKGSRT